MVGVQGACHTHEHIIKCGSCRATVNMLLPHARAIRACQHDVCVSRCKVQCFNLTLQTFCQCGAPTRDRVGHALCPLAVFLTQQLRVAETPAARYDETHLMNVPCKSAHPRLTAVRGSHMLISRPLHCAVTAACTA